MFAYINFVLPAWYNARKKCILIIGFYAVGIVSTKFEGHCQATYQQIVVCTGTSSLAWTLTNICLETSIVDETMLILAKDRG